MRFLPDSPAYTDENQRSWVLDNVLSLPGEANGLYEISFDTNMNKYISVLFSEYFSLQNSSQKNAPQKMIHCLRPHAQLVISLQLVKTAK